MEFRILGPLEVLADGRALDLGGPKQRALLALLLLEANQVVPRDRLIDALWDEEPTATAVKALQIYVSQLRKLLGRERLETKAPGYRLRVEPEELDLARCQRLHQDGRLEQALALWRGPPLAEFAYQRFAQPEIARMQELRLALLEERIDHGLVAGQAAQLIPELEALVNEHPLREGLRAQLMLALYRAGRQADALDAYQHARATLVEELGIEPGRSLRDLHQAILIQDPVLDLPVEEGPEPEETAPAAPPPPAAPAAHDVRKTVTAVFVRLTISSAQGAGLDPEALRRVTTRAFGEVGAAVEHHGGTVETVAGDGVTAVFGLPAVHEDDALRAVRAAAEARDALAGLAVRLATDGGLALEFRVGISTGQVIAAGDPRSQLRATGEPLTLSSRLAEASDAGEILFDEGTRRLVRAAVVTEAAKDAWRLLQITEAGQAPVVALVSPMIGRERERRRLQDAFEQAVGDRSCQLFTLLGLAGVGKSRLVQEFIAELEGRALVAGGRCLPYGEGITFWPVLEALREAVGLQDSASPEENLAKLAQALAGERNAEDLARQVAGAIGFAPAAGGVEDGFRALRTLFAALAREQPLVLVFDDIHWGEATFLDLVEDIADSLRDAPILVVCLARPELLDARSNWAGGKLNATSVLLEPLSDEQCARLIGNLVGQAGLAEEVESRIVEVAEGNPLFVEEMLLMLIDDRRLVRKDGRWAASGDVAAVQVPPTIQALLAARLDRLGAEERAVIERAAVEGKVFHVAALSQLAPDSLRPAVGMHLDALVRKELIRPARPEFAGERAFRFRHLLIRDAAYDSIAKASRAQLHDVFARWLEERAGDATAGFEEIIGYHLEQAYRYRAELEPLDDELRALAGEAARRLGAAGSRAFMRRDPQAAVSLVSRAVSLLPADDPARVDLVPNVRVVQGISGDFGWAEAVLTEATAAGDERLRAHALVQQAFLRLFTQPETVADEAVAAGERAIRVFGRLGDELGLARAWRLIGQAHYAARRAGPSADASEHALVHIRRAGDRPAEQTETVEWLAVALFAGPVPVYDVIARLQRLLTEVAGKPVLEVLLMIVIANLLAARGDVEAARKLMHRARRLRDERVERIWFFPANFVLIRFLDDDPAGAEPELRWGYEEQKRTGEKSHFSTIAAMLARSSCGQGRFDEAERLTRESEEAAGAGDVNSQILWRTTRGIALARGGDLQAGEAWIREAVEFAAESDFLLYHGDALMDLGEVLGLTGSAGEARSAVERALRLYEQKRDVVAAARAKARLEELAST